jgi:predicted ATPase
VIRGIRFDNYKGLSGEHVLFGDLTLLTGTNGAGKSSVIQAVLLTLLASRTPSGFIPLNDSFGLALGDACDVIDHGRGDTEVKFEFEIDGRECHVVFAADEGRRYLRLVSNASDLPALHGLGLDAFGYIAAERNGPRETYDLPTTRLEMTEVSYCGDNVASLLLEHERQLVHQRLEHPSAPKLRFIKQVEAWLGEFAPDTELRVEANPEFGKAALRFKCKGLRAEWLRPGNIGFGITYCLPIVVAALLTHAGSLLIVDSPEAHLHPSAQSAMGQFLSLVASTGAQVIVETHSDHILNGVRLASLQDGRAPQREKIVINHFSRRGRPVVSPITISAYGELSHRPPDFFDQTEKDLAEIVKRRLGEKRSKLE